MASSFQSASPGEEEGLDPRVKAAKRKLHEEAEKRAMVEDSEPVWVPCSHAEKSATPKGWEDFGRHLCSQFKRDSYNVWPMMVKIADGRSKHPNFIQALGPIGEEGAKKLTLAEVPPELRLPGRLGTGEEDLCGCGPGHGWSTEDFACIRDLEPSISPGLESRICSTFGPAGAEPPKQPEDSGAFDDNAGDKEQPKEDPVEQPVFVRPLEVMVVKDPPGLKGNFLRVIPDIALKGREFAMAVFSKGSPSSAGDARDSMKAA